MIPALIVPILNGPEHLRAMLNSIDHPIGQVIIIDNGGVVNWRPAMTVSHGHIGDCVVISLPSNLGVAASWNLGIKVAPMSPWHLIVNHDIEFSPEDLALLEGAVDPSIAAIYHLSGPSEPMSWAAFAMTAPALDRLGYFDEQFAPAYDEDVDMARRADLAGVPRINVAGQIRHSGSSTIKSDPLYEMRNGLTHGLNDRYYEAKWGGSKYGGERFDTPFNRGGSVADWTLESKRLRDQHWPRSR